MGLTQSMGDAAVRRRELIVFAGTVLVAWPLAADAQQAGKIPKIGVLSSGPSATWAGFRQGLRELGYAEGRTILIEWRWTDGKAERAHELARELARLQPRTRDLCAPADRRGKGGDFGDPHRVYRSGRSRQSGARRHSRPTLVATSRVSQRWWGPDSRGN